MVCDQWTVELIKETYFPPPPPPQEGQVADETPAEDIEVCTAFEYCKINDTTYEQVMVVLSTHQKLYFFHTNYEFWMCDQESDNVKFLELLPGLEEPIKFCPDWKVYPLTGAEKSDCPSIEIREKSTGGGRGRASTLGACIFQAYFSTYTACQCFWQACREARVLCDGSGNLQGRMNDLLP
jgi:hypothetical protein